MTKEKELTVFISTQNSTCSNCKESLGKNAWIILNSQENNKNIVLCLDCADLAHLEFLPSGDAAMTRRSKKYSNLTAVVLKWSKTRKRYERQGLLVEAEALEKAEEECLEDKEVRERRKVRDATRRSELDQKYINKFSKRIRELYPECQEGTEYIIANHACQKYSDRIGRSESAKNLEEEAITLAVRAHVRHKYTNYDKMLMSGIERIEARQAVISDIEDVLAAWKGN